MLISANKKVKVLKKKLRGQRGKIEKNLMKKLTFQTGRVNRRLFSSSSSGLHNHLIMSPLLGLNEKEKQLYSEAREFGETEFQPHSREWDSQSFFPRDLMRKVGEKGYGGMMVSRDVGGSGYTRKECVVICEALAKSCVSTTALITVNNLRSSFPLR
jgi:alkylation response protein AidB-like acyl-CoA dehydrogenase